MVTNAASTPSTVFIAFSTRGVILALRFTRQQCELLVRWLLSALARTLSTFLAHRHFGPAFNELRQLALPQERSARAAAARY
jgi:hypothetical protein